MSAFASSCRASSASPSRQGSPSRTRARVRTVSRRVRRAPSISIATMRGGSVATGAAPAVAAARQKSAAQATARLRRRAAAGHGDSSISTRVPAKSFGCRKSTGVPCAPVRGSPSAEHPRPLRRERGGRGAHVGDLEREVVDAARGALLEEGAQRGALAEGRDQLDLRVRQRDEDDRHAVVREVLRRGDAGAGEARERGARRLEVGDRDRDVVEPPAGGDGSAAPPCGVPPTKLSRSRRAPVVGASAPSRTARSRSASVSRTPGWARSRSSSVSAVSVQSHSPACPARRAARAPLRRERLAVAEHRLPGPGDPGAGERGTGLDGDLPPGGAGAQERERVAVGVDGARRRVGQVAVGLVDEHQVGQLDDAALDPLQLVAAAGDEQEQEEVRHAGDRGLALSDAHGLDEHDVEARGLADEERLAGAARDAAERAAGGRRTDEGLRAARQLGHARLVAEDRAAARRRGGVDREDRDAAPLREQVQAERLDERGLAGAGDAGDADAEGAAGGGREQFDEAGGLVPVVGAGRLDEGHGARERPAVAGAHRRRQLLDRLHALGSALVCRSSPCRLRGPVAAHPRRCSLRCAPPGVPRFAPPLRQTVPVGDMTPAPVGQRDSAAAGRRRADALRSARGPQRSDRSVPGGAKRIV